MADKLIGVMQADREAAWNNQYDIYKAAIDAQRKARWMRGDYDHNRDIQAFAAHRAQALTAENERLREAVLKIMHLDYPRPVETQYMPSHPTKHDKCRHGLAMYEDCGECISDFAAETLRGQS